MSRAARKTLINELSGWVSSHKNPPDIKLREHLLTKLDSDVDLEAEAKAFYAPKKVAKKPAKKKRSSRRG